MLTLCLLFGSAAVLAADNYVVLYGFAFDINSDGKAVIHHYDDRSADVNIPSSLLDADVTEIADYAFFGDTVITSLSFADAAALSRIGANAFNGCSSLRSLIIPGWIGELSFGSFQNCSGLTSLSMGEGIDVIPTQCFYGCTSLAELRIPESVSTIASLAFGGCTSLTRVVIPGTVESIAANAFNGCDDLVICCTEGSYALSYAIENGISYDTAIRYEYVLGDADADGVITILDATKIQRLLAALIEDTDGLMALRADCNRDGLNIMDATKIQRYLAGFTVSEPIGEIMADMI